VSYGGNLAINVGPQPNGELPLEAQKILREMGEWLRANGEAIYGTRADVGRVGNVMFTKKGDVRYALLPLAKGEMLGEAVRIPVNGRIRSVRLLASGAAVDFVQDSEGIAVSLPEEWQGTNPYAVVFALT
jgi:alpha-L-fucosidase